MKIKIVQDAVICVSAITMEEFNTVKKFAPQALVLNKVDENNKKVPVCMLDYANAGGVNKNGIIFDSTTDEGYLCHTFVGAEGYDPHCSTEEKVKLISEEYAGLILNVNELEEQIHAALVENADKIERAKASIEAINL